MEAIKIKGTEDTPTVIFDAAENYFEISGRSLPEDVTSFYGPLLSWLSEYAKQPNPKTVFNFKLEYFNTASSKLILDVLMKLEEISRAGHEVLVKWHYPEDDEDMQEAGNEYADIVEVPFELVAYS
ncbi:MAG: DUF1987 domain-containing protein [Bacteroidales bacterium]|nr:DUF1987 domain-containing protein [Bacteroidales bacterium]HPO65170.1 DUF1987 domain-containing protein [Bacteroidales bacterium]